MSDYRIYHNPGCGTSRNVLALMRRCGIEPDVIEYLKTPPSREELVDLLDFIGQHPILMNRPIVVSPLGTRLCRPSEVVLGLLPSPPARAFHEEDGELVLDASGRRVD
jgi:arsenate reductase